MIKLGQETIAIAVVTVGLAPGGLNVTGTHSIRSGMQGLRAGAGADREAFGQHVTRLTQSLPPA